MVDDAGIPPLPRRVPGASGSPRPTVRVELGVISEDLRQRVLTAIASELERDEAERLRNAQEQDGAGDRGSHGVWGTGDPGRAGDAVRADDAANGYGVSPANGSSAGLDNGSGPGLDNGSGASLGTLTGSSLNHGIDTSPANSPPWDQGAPWPGTPGQREGTPQGDAANRSRGGTDDAVAAAAPGGTAGHAEATDAGDAADGRDEAALPPAVPLPRRAPGTNGAPPPPAALRREYLPPSLLGRTLDPEAHTEPLPRISGTGPSPGPGAPAEAGIGQSAPSVFSPARPAAPPPAASDPSGSPVEPGSSGSGPSTPVAPGAPAESAPPSAEAVPPETVPPETVSPHPVPPRPTPSATTMAAASAPTMPVGSAAMAAAAGLVPPAETVQTAAGQALPADLAAPAAPAGRAAPPPPLPAAPADWAAPPPPLPAAPVSALSRPPAASQPVPPRYGWGADQGGTRPGNNRGAGTALPLPAALPAAGPPRRSGRTYRIAGVILAVVALVVAGVIALVLSGRTTPGHGTGLGPPSRGAGAVARKRAAAWVAGQVSRTVVVACDPVMCQTLKAHGVAASRLYQLGPQTTSPLRSQVIVATAAVRAQFGNVLSSVYAPAVLASFGLGPYRIDIRVTAQHGAAAYRALLGADLANRKASGTQLLSSGRIAAGAVARRELAAGEIDGRLLIAIAQMAATHPMFIVDFGSPAPGADPGMPLRQADVAEDAHARHHADHVVSAGYVRSMISFLHAQHGPFRPTRVQAMHLADGAAVLRIQFTAPSPLGLLGPHA